MNTVGGVIKSMKSTIANPRFRNILLLIYILVVLGFSATVRAEMTIEPVIGAPVAAEMKTLTGEVAITPEGQAFLIVSNQVYYELRTTDADLSAFNGMSVMVRGYELMHRVGPVYQLSSFNPLLDEDTKQMPAPVLVVLQINELVVNY